MIDVLWALVSGGPSPAAAALPSSSAADQAQLFRSKPPWPISLPARVPYIGTMTDIEKIRDNFALLDDWEDRCRYNNELGEELEPYPESARDAEHKVQGCVSQVWL